MAEISSDLSASWTASMDCCDAKDHTVGGRIDRTSTFQGCRAYAALLTHPPLAGREVVAVVALHVDGGLVRQHLVAPQGLVVRAHLAHNLITRWYMTSSSSSSAGLSSLGAVCLRGARA